MDQETHLQINGDTNGWDTGTSVLSVVANAGPGVTAGTQGGFWDYWYRAVYPGQDSAAMYVGNNGIVPVAQNAPVAAFGSVGGVDLAGNTVVFGTVVLATPLTETQIAALNSAKGPLRVQVNNGFFGYTLPPALAPVSADGRTLKVDNWTRAIAPSNAAPRGVAGGTATFPTFPYWTPPNANVATYATGTGTGVLPNQVGLTNGSAPLLDYTVSIGGNYLADAVYGEFRIGNSDLTNTARFAEVTGVNNKTGTSSWNELEVLSDQLNGQTFLTNFIFGGCQNDDGVGNGTCGAMLLGWNGLKRIVVCENSQISLDEGGTDCVLDNRSTFGFHSVKSAGYVIYVDPAAASTLDTTGSTFPRFVLDAQGNTYSLGSSRWANGAGFDLAGKLTAASGQVNGLLRVYNAAGTSQNAYVDGSTGVFNTNYGFQSNPMIVAKLPPCFSTNEGLRASVTDASSPAYLKALTGGGTVHSPAYCNGSVWVSGG